MSPSFFSSSNTSPRFPSLTVSSKERRQFNMPVSTYFIDHNLDEYDHMSMDIHRHVNSPHSGKGRSKREAKANTNRPDQSGHCRKTVQKLINNAHKHRA
ncbi:nuclear protein 1 [Elysia marginata]|uniref:Nuclear protein 1 n=1 Tax=Elysia marginata TaxID=1093978 RepID=A0AAV4HER8_9GAST|nr:nuclear protein 1 [Elysia marginata]